MRTRAAVPGQAAAGAPGAAALCAANRGHGHACMHACMRDRETLRQGAGSSDRLPFELAGGEGGEGYPARRVSSRRPGRSRGIHRDPEPNRYFTAPFPLPNRSRAPPDRLHGPAVAIQGDPRRSYTDAYRSTPIQARPRTQPAGPGRSRSIQGRQDPKPIIPRSTALPNTSGLGPCPCKGIPSRPNG